MAKDTRHKNGNWNLGESITWERVPIAVLMDIRDQLQQQNRHLAALEGLARCYRIPRALDAMHELGVEARRRKRNAAKKRKATANNR